MRLRLESKFAKLITIAVAVTLLAPYSFVAWSRYRAARVADNEDRQSLERAIQLEPGDARYQERLARYILFVEQDASTALIHFQMAAAINPNSARNWLGVAQAQLILGNSDAALKAIDHALEVDPTTPAVSWEAGNLLVTLGQSERAMRQFQLTLASDPTMVWQGLQLIRRMESPAEAAKEALPPDPAIYASFISLLLQSKDVANAKLVWAELIALKRPFDPRFSFPLLGSLIASGDLDSATQVWADLAKANPDVARLTQDNNLIHNASFEYNVLNGGFDWVLPGTSTPDPVLQTDISNAHGGKRSLMASFDGTRPLELGLAQLLILDGNSRFRFTGYIKADLQTANGLTFVIADMKSSKRVLETDEVVEGNRWIKASGEFRTGPEKSIYVLRILRTGSSLIRGTAWVDDLSLVKEPE